MPTGWDMGFEAPALEGTAFRVQERVRSTGFQHTWEYALVLRPTPNWLATRKGPHLLSLLGVLAPTAHRLRTGRCPFCGEGPDQVTWSHVLRDCDVFWDEHVAAELWAWRPLILE